MKRFGKIIGLVFTVLFWVALLSTLPHFRYALYTFIALAYLAVHIIPDAKDPYLRFYYPFWRCFHYVWSGAIWGAWMMILTSVNIFLEDE